MGFEGSSLGLRSRDLGSQVHMCCFGLMALCLRCRGEGSLLLVRSEI